MKSTLHRAAAQAVALASLLALPVVALAGDNGVQPVRKFPAQPVSTPIADAAGNLFATSSSGGAYGAGFVYELVAPGAGQSKWSLRHLYDFDGTSVSYPLARLAADSAGNLYGVSYSGGSAGFGALYALSRPKAGGHWLFTLLHSFLGGHDGEFPVAGVTIGPDGTIYGTTRGGGVIGVGTAYTLSPPDQSGKRSYRVIREFHGEVGATDGDHPQSNLLLDGAGNLIGTATDYGLDNGEVFELSPANGGWRVKILYKFQGGNDGVLPTGALTSDGAGHIFGTTLNGGTANLGTAFELTPPAGGSKDWTEQSIASFGTSATDANMPTDGVSLDGQGRLFGATAYGGGNGTFCLGAVFRLTPPAQGSTAWTKDVLALLGEPNTLRLGCNAAGSVTPLVGGKFFGVTGENAAPGVLYSVTP